MKNKFIECNHVGHYRTPIHVRQGIWIPSEIVNAMLFSSMKQVKLQKQNKKDLRTKIVK